MFFSCYLRRPSVPQAALRFPTAPGIPPGDIARMVSNRSISTFLAVPKKMKHWKPGSYGGKHYYSYHSDILETIIYLFAACDDIVDSDYIYMCVVDVYTVYSLCNYLSWLADYSGWYYEKVRENPKTAKNQQVKRVRCGFGVCKSP